MPPRASTPIKGQSWLTARRTHEYNIDVHNMLSSPLPHLEAEGGNHTKFAKSAERYLSVRCEANIGHSGHVHSKPALDDGKTPAEETGIKRIGNNV